MPRPYHFVRRARKLTTRTPDLRETARLVASHHVRGRTLEYPLRSTVTGRRSCVAGAVSRGPQNRFPALQASGSSLRFCTL